MNTLLLIDENLFAMVQHEDVSPKVQLYWQNHNARLFSAFGRLGSFISFPSNKFSLLELAENGLYNTGDLLYDVRHYLDPEKKLDQIQNLRSDQTLCNFVENSLPENRMVQGYPNPNIPLSVTINSLPPQYHSRNENLSKSKISHVAQSDECPYVATVSNNGDVKLWNTDVGLVCLASDNFRGEFNKPELVLQKSKEEKESVGLAGAVAAEDAQAKTVEGTIVPDASMVEALYNMGFSIDLAKKH